MATWADWLRFTVLAVVVVSAAWHDVRRGRAPNRLTLGAIAGGLLLALGIALARMAMGASAEVVGQELGLAALGLAAGLVPMAILFFSGAMGGADVKMMAAVGAISASWPVAVETFFNAFVVAAVLAVAIMIRKRLVKRTAGRIFGAALTALARGRPTLQDSPPVPFLLAVAVGAIVSAGRHLLGWPIPWGLDV